MNYKNRKPLTVLDFCINNKCKGEMLLKKNNENGHLFLECSKSPKCDINLKVTKADVKKFINARIEDTNYCYQLQGNCKQSKDGLIMEPKKILFLKKEDYWKDC